MTHAQLDHPETQRVSDVGVAAGEAWRSLTPDQKAIYEEQSVASKVCPSPVWRVTWLLYMCLVSID